MECKKDSVKGEASLDDGGDTVVIYIHANGEFCEFGIAFKGNPLGLELSETRTLPLGNGGGGGGAGADPVMIDAFDIVEVNADGSAGDVLLSTSGLVSVSF